MLEVDEFGGKHSNHNFLTKATYFLSFMSNRNICTFLCRDMTYLFNE